LAACNPPRVAQSAEASRSNREGCRCKSCHADHFWNVNRTSEPGLGANECVPSGMWRKPTTFRQSLQDGQPSARSSKRTVRLISGVALDECLDPERYRTRTNFHRVDSVILHSTLFIFAFLWSLNAKQLERPSKAEWMPRRISSLTDHAALKYKPLRLQASQWTFELFEVGIRAVNLNPEDLRHL
jgi:hypothetical protein